MKAKHFLIPLIGLVFAASASGGLEDRSSDVTLRKAPHNEIQLPDVASPSEVLTASPATGQAWLYNDGNQLYFATPSGRRVLISATQEYAVELCSVFVDGTGPITSSTAPNCTTTDNVAAIVYDGSNETAEIQFSHASGVNFAGLEIRLRITSDTAASTGQSVDWAIYAHDADASIATVVAQDAVSLGNTNLDASEEEILLTLDATGITAVTGGDSVITVAIFNAGTANGSLEIKAITVREL